MKVDFYSYNIQTIRKQPNYALKSKSPKNNETPENTEKTTDTQALTPSSNALYYKPMFGSACCSHILYTNMSKLGDAYGNTEMLSPYEVKNIYKRLTKRPNALSTINLLKQYRGNMHKVEGMVFDMFCEFPDKVNNDFQGILCLSKDKSLKDLKEKQIIVINSADDSIKELRNSTRQDVEEIKNWSLNSIHNDTFCRKVPLAMLEDLQASSPEEKSILWQIYKSFYQLPSSSKDMDAFIVKYSKRSHDQIAQRLISPSVATIEHLIPTSRGGKDELGNCVLTSAGLNHGRQHLVLSKFIELNQDLNIRENLQQYINKATNLTFNENLTFFNQNNYPNSIIKSLRQEHVENFKLQMPESKSYRIKKKPIIYNQITSRKSYNVHRH